MYRGIEAVVVDYIRPIIFGDVIPKVAQGLWLLISIATLGGLFYFIYTDIGIAKSIRKLWSIKGQYIFYIVIIYYIYVFIYIHS